MLKKLVLVMFIISMLFMTSCSDEDSDVYYRIKEIVHSEYNTTDSVWMNTEIDYFDYDTNDRLISGNKILEWNSNLLYSVDYTYNTASDIIPKEYYATYFREGLPENYKAEYTYENGKTKKIILSYPDVEDNYTDQFKFYYTYENDLLVTKGKDTMSPFTTMTPDSSSWSYDSGYLVEYISFNPLQDYYERILYEYSNDDLIETDHYWWDYIHSEWALVNSGYYEYQNGLLKMKFQLIGFGGAPTKEVYEYTENDISVINQYYMHGPDWIMFEKKEFIYEEGSGNYKELLKALYPELFNTGINVSVGHVSLFEEPGGF